MEKKVSIVIPAYNVEQFIVGCIDSARMQTYDNTEIIVIDDGSQDNTWKLMESMCEKDQRIRIYHQENRGVSATRNRGIDLAEGYYCVFLDGDDYLEPNAIAVMVSAMEKSQADWLNCHYYREDEAGNPMEKYPFLVGERQFVEMSQKLDFMLQKLFSYQIGFEVWDKMYLLQVIKEHDIRFNEKCQVGEDLAFNISYLLRIHRLVCIEEACYHYRIRRNSAMRSVDNLQKKLSENLIMLQGIKEEFSQLQDPYLDDRFYFVFAVLMDNTYGGSSANQVVDALEKLPQKEFLYEILQQVVRHKKNLSLIYPPEISTMKWRFHLYIWSRLGQGKLSDKLYLLGYNVYRKIRNRETLADWVMP